MQDKLNLQMAPDEASWATFMGQVEHGSTCPSLSLDLQWPNFPQGNTQRIKKTV